MADAPAGTVGARRALLALAAGTVLGLALLGDRWFAGGGEHPPPALLGGPPSSARADELVHGAPPGSALELVGELDVRGRSPRSGYDRDAFGQAWADVDRNGCDTRNDVLARDLRDVVLRGRDDCVVLSGTLDDPYGSSTVAFARGERSGAVQIDHVVALSDAWQKGAQQWPRPARVAFANDPLNLLAVDGPLNEEKSDADAATWLPPARAHRCAYVARQVAVKHAYDLWVTPAERAAVVGVLSRCPDQEPP